MSKKALLVKTVLSVVILGGVVSNVYSLGKMKGEVEALEKFNLSQTNSQIQTLKRQVAETSRAVNRLDVAYRTLHNALGKVELDVFKVTAYSPYDDRNGLNSQGDPSKTSIGATPREGTIAVNPEIIPYGSTIVILYEDGTIETGRAEDTGGALRVPGNKQVDVFRRTFDEAMRHGVKSAVVLWNKEVKQ